MDTQEAGGSGGDCTELAQDSRSRVINFKLWPIYPREMALNPVPIEWKSGHANRTNVDVTLSLSLSIYIYIYKYKRT
jgi:hypothetical protein